MTLPTGGFGHPPPAAYRVLVLKSAQHFAGAFGPIASLIVRGETGGCCPTDPRRHEYRDGLKFHDGQDVTAAELRAPN